MKFQRGGVFTTQVYTDMIIKPSFYWYPISLEGPPDCEFFMCGHTRGKCGCIASIRVSEMDYFMSTERINEVRDSIRQTNNTMAMEYVQAAYIANNRNYIYHILKTYHC